jgi:hypothetical protein
MVTNVTGGEKPALTRTLPHEVCGCNLIPRVRSNRNRLADEMVVVAGALRSRRQSGFDSPSSNGIP